ncbi:MAG: Gfo/Idh/MocA family oxidoreductase [Candidatus Marinimicrobia bacterium]|nr:Gfo/Idh/MocA family oxidoreductase [Candidatus Neomarinimicrobiota bacterium]MCF7850382.1 Gfo/Idh/MocA family oxidoreductase [Candidatus Neomarinimicrobiota bacterium]MCF7904984.1 Gfo/Idh/MocA family oxidoreductase [Candidatus Neomarinimicrobiota bacterium]
MSKNYKWGIIGTGRISNIFIEGLQSLEKAESYAVASRSQASADDFAKKWSIKHAYGSYEDLYKDPDIDIVYIATPISSHHRDTLNALEAGKHVLCEKAFALNADQAQEMIQVARDEELFLMEAMWNRFQPWYEKATEILDENLLGELYHLKADLSFQFPFDPKHRLFDPSLGGGCLLDLGVYPIALSSLFMGPPASIACTANLCPTGVDDQVSMIFTHENGATSELGCSSRYNTNQIASLHGSKGFLEIHGLIGRPERLVLHQNGQAPVIHETPYEFNGYQYEAQAVMDMLDSKEIEHPRMPLDETFQTMAVMDYIRENIGVLYPGEIQ